MKAALAIRWRRWSWFLRHQLGLAGAVAAATATQWLDEQRRHVLHKHVAQLDASARLSQVAAPAIDPRDVAWQAIPGDAERGAVLARLLATLEQARVEVSGAQYRLEDEAGLRRLRVTVPVRGGYAGVRALAVSVLNGMPNAALDGLELDRDAEAVVVNGRLRLSLFFRKEGA
jgi:hypothetical protein